MVLKLHFRDFLFDSDGNIRFFFADYVAGFLLSFHFFAFSSLFLHFSLFSFLLFSFSFFSFSLFHFLFLYFSIFYFLFFLFSFLFLSFLFLFSIFFFFTFLFFQNCGLSNRGWSLNNLVTVQDELENFLAAPKL